MLRVGLTGGIACGKSHVLRRLASRGLRTLDLDQVAREVVAPGSPALAEIEAAFGSSMLRRGALDRAALATRVFGDAAARARLDAIVHPRVWTLEARWTQAQPPDAVSVVDAALLVETGAHLRFDRLVVVHCEAELQLARLRARDGLDEAAARARVDAQMPLAEKRGFGHYQIDTSGSPGDSDLAADELAATLARLASEPPAADPATTDRLVSGLLHGPVDGPRGLSPERLLRAADAGRGLELQPLAGRLAPPAQGPWYRAAEAEPPASPATRLAVALAAWACARRPGDAALAVAAAGSVARLVHADPGSRADACLAAFVALERACRPRLAGTVSLAAGGLELATRFGGGAPSGRLQPLWQALELYPDEPVAAAARCGALGGDAPTAGALAGLAARRQDTAASRAVRELIERLDPTRAPRRPASPS